MSKAANNNLLGSGKVQKEEKKEVKSVNGPIKLYREDYPQGRVYEGAEVIEMMKRKKWREQPFEVVEEEKIEVKVVAETPKEKKEVPEIKGMKITSGKKEK